MYDILTELDALWAGKRYAPRPDPGPIPSENIFSDPLARVGINRLWVPHILGVLSALDQPDAWNGTETEIFAARQQVRDLMLALMSIEAPVWRLGVSGQSELGATTRLG